MASPQRGIYFRRAYGIAKAIPRCGTIFSQLAKPWLPGLARTQFTDGPRRGGARLYPRFSAVGRFRSTTKYDKIGDSTIMLLEHDMRIWRSYASAQTCCCRPDVGGIFYCFCRCPGQAHNSTDSSRGTVWESGAL